VKRTLGVREGQLYNETSLEGVKRGLYLTEAFRHVAISVDSGRLGPEDSLVDITVSLVASEARAARVALGWGNLDCFRAQGSHTNYNFLGALRRLDINARVSKVGVDKPFEAARRLCTSELLRDPLSDTLNYYLGITYSQPALFRTRSIPVVSLYSERRSEYQAFLRSVPLGIAASVQQGVDGPFPMTWSYQLEYGRTLAQPAFFCAVFNVCEDAARVQLERLQRSAVLGWSASRSRVDNVVTPRSGSVVRLELRHASPPVGSAREVQFSRATLDAALYRPALGGALALRVRVGTVLGARLRALDSKTFIPLQERLYAGGANTVRGYRQNELGPAIYLPNQYQIVPVPGADSLAYFRADPQQTSERIVPTGGDNLVVANAELRLRSVLFPDLIEWALFADAGQVWNKGRQGTGIAFRDVKVTPGAGMRVFSFVGPIRVDVGYNPYSLPPGPAYFNPPPNGAPAQEVLRLICVSPGNTLRVRPGTPPQPVDQGDCPATYVPAVRRSFFSRLTFNFSIGQPF
jgi:outer membrane protein insertion porin family/translocation and assembly module TamA